MVYYMIKRKTLCTPGRLIETAPSDHSWLRLRIYYYNLSVATRNYKRLGVYAVDFENVNSGQRRRFVRMWSDSLGNLTSPCNIIRVHLYSRCSAEIVYFEFIRPVRSLSSNTKTANLFLHCPAYYRFDIHIYIYI